MIWQINILPPPGPNYNVTLNIQPIISAFYTIAGMLIAALALSSAAIALPLLAINRKLAVMNAGLAGNLATELMRERREKGKL